METRFIEALESRQHMDVSPSAVSYSLRVNFAPMSAPSVPGYRLDYGAKFSRRGNGNYYGWSSSRISAATYHDVVRYDSVRAETGIAMGTASWSVRVPNGWYDVRILMGDPSTLKADYRVNVEGQLAVKGVPYTNFPFVEGSKVIKVTDGVLNVSSAKGAVNNKIASIGIFATSIPKKTAQGVNIKWSLTGVNSPIYRAESGAVRVGNKLYVLGGFTSAYESVTNRVDILDLKTNKWTRGASLPGAQTHFGATTDGRYIYLAGGQYGPMLSIKGTNQVWRYEIATNRWAAMKGLPDIRFGGQLQYLKGRLHFIGGDDRTRVRARADHWIYDLSKPQLGWYTGRALPQPTDHHASIIVNQQLYVLGGEVEHGTSYLQNSGLFRYDDRANRWITLASMPLGVSHNEASTLTDGRRIFVIAGQADQQQLTAQVRSYDIAKNRWELHTPLPTARKAGVAWIMGNRLFYMTGDDEKFGEPRSTYVGVIG